MQDKKKGDLTQPTEIKKKKYILDDFSSSKNFQFIEIKKNRLSRNVLKSSISNPLFSVKSLLNFDSCAKKVKSSNLEKIGQGEKNTNIIQNKYNEINSGSSQFVRKHIHLPPNTSISEQKINFEKSLSVNQNDKKEQKTQSETVWCVAIAPVHLRGLDVIAKIFGKSKQTIKSWHDYGAPIAFDGRSYATEYVTLFTWYLDFYRNKKNLEQENS